MFIEKTSLEGVLLIYPFHSEDNRGFFMKDYSFDLYLNDNFLYNLKETFYSFSKKGVLRGLHFQYAPMQPKLVRCMTGHILDVVVDLRKESPTYKKWLSFDLEAGTSPSIYVPPGFAHGFYSFEDALVSYKCGECFSPETDSGIIWNDHTLNIEWPTNKPIQSEKDKSLQSFETFEKNYHLFRY